MADIETERLALRELTLDDLSATQEIVCDEQAMYAWNVAIRNNMLIRRRFIKQYKGEDMPHYVFSARKKDERQALGDK